MTAEGELRALVWFGLRPTDSGNGRQPIDGEYVERFYLPLVGPSVLLLARWALREAALGHVVITAAELGRRLGLGPAHSPNSALGRTVRRAVSFRLLHRTLAHGDDEQATYLMVNTHVPLLSQRQRGQLTTDLYGQEEKFIANL